MAFSYRMSVDRGFFKEAFKRYWSPKDRLIPASSRRQPSSRRFRAWWSTGPSSSHIASCRLVRTLGGQILSLNGFVTPYSQVKWIFSIKMVQDKALILLELNSHAKTAPDTAKRRAG